MLKTEEKLKTKERNEIAEGIKNLFKDAKLDLELTMRTIPVLRYLIKSSTIDIENIKDEHERISEFVLARLKMDNSKVVDRTLMETCTPNFKLTKGQIMDLASKCECFEEFAAYVCYFPRMDPAFCQDKLRGLKSRAFYSDKNSNMVVSPWSIFKTYYHALAEASEVENLEQELKIAIDSRENIWGSKDQSKIASLKAKIMSDIADFESSRKICSIDIFSGLNYAKVHEFENPSGILSEIRYYTNLIQMHQNGSNEFKHCEDLLCILKAERVRAIYRYKISSPASKIKLNGIEGMAKLNGLLSKIESTTHFVSENIIAMINAGFDASITVMKGLSKVPVAVKLAIQKQKADKAIKEISDQSEREMASRILEDSRSEGVSGKTMELFESSKL